ncbi:hypothetical protein N7520_009574 [Penicillium odoratum]|uniref:uncharacterized protein n=1 Tax=Penicillium odoratum TaxID=1167516 RepID=UPI0025479AA7|nr:uncharacterized protein N7520_009574 [Penicillium odoratum]KAJ5752657.1 hypothetical protein N7520_009574 [Penicillium odoratum]
MTMRHIPTPSAQGAIRILVINPNTSTVMTDGLKPILKRLNYSDVEYEYFTAPDEPVTIGGHTFQPISSINSGEESAQSALNCWSVLDRISQFDAFLVACYSAHPLVGVLRKNIREFEKTHPSTRKKYVTGIFEASVTASLSLISAFDFVTLGELEKKQVDESFGIVTTGSIWKEELGKAVTKMLGTSNGSSRFAGVETTGLTAVELHTTPPEEVKRRIIDATQRLLRESPVPVTAICMGCAGMAGMEEAVREGCIRGYGEIKGREVRIVDGVVAGVGTLVTSCKAGF